MLRRRADARELTRATRTSGFRNQLKRKDGDPLFAVPSVTRHLRVSLLVKSGVRVNPTPLYQRVIQARILFADSRAFRAVVYCERGYAVKCLRVKGTSDDRFEQRKIVVNIASVRRYARKAEYNYEETRAYDRALRVLSV